MPPAYVLRGAVRGQARTTGDSVALNGIGDKGWCRARGRNEGCDTPQYGLAVIRVAKVTLESGLRLSYAEHGAPSGPVALLLPGPTDSWRSYEPVLDRLTPRMRAIALSQRGHGDSDKPESDYEIDDFAADVIEFLDALGIDQAVLAGHSASCLVARRVAMDHPGRVAGLILEASPTNLGSDVAFQGFVNSVVLNLRDPISRDFARSFVVDTSSEDVAPEVIDQFVDELLKVPARVWQAMFSGLLKYDDVAELTRITVPTLLIWGEADGLVSRTMQEILTTRIPTAELTIYSNAGHTPRWEDPQRFSEDISAFFEKLRRPA